MVPSILVHVIELFKTISACMLMDAKSDSKGVLSYNDLHTSHTKMLPSCTISTLISASPIGQAEYSAGTKFAKFELSFHEI